MSATATVFAWIGLVLGLAIALVVVVLFQNLLGFAREIQRYAADVLDAGVGIATNLDGVDEAVRTRELATAVPPLAVAYLQKLGKVPG